MARALVTGCAGFIGSHLTEALLGTATRCSASTASTTTTRAPTSARTSRARATTTRSSSSPATSSTLDADALLERRRRRLPPRGRARRALELGPALRPLHAPQRRRHPAAAGGDARPPRQALRVRLLVVGLRRRARRCPRHEDDDAAPALPVRRDQARGRAPVRALRRGARRRHRRAALLLRLRPAPAPRHGVPALLRGDRAPASRSRSSATAARRATSRSSATSSPPRAPRRRPTRRPGRVYNIGGGDERQRQPRAGDARGDRRPPARRAPPRAPGGRRADTGADTTRARAELGFAPAHRPPGRPRRRARRGCVNARAPFLGCAA